MKQQHTYVSYAGKPWRDIYSGFACWCFHIALKGKVWIWTSSLFVVGLLLEVLLYFIFFPREPAAWLKSRLWSKDGQSTSMKQILIWHDPVFPPEGLDLRHILRHLTPGQDTLGHNSSLFGKKKGDFTNLTRHIIAIERTCIYNITCLDVW